MNVILLPRRITKNHLYTARFLAASPHAGDLALCRLQRALRRMPRNVVYVEGANTLTECPVLLTIKAVLSKS